jgi:hypothetical protein
MLDFVPVMLYCLSCIPDARGEQGRRQMNFRVIANRPVSDHLYAEAHTAIDTGERRRSSDWSPEKVVFWVLLALFAIAWAV